MDSAPGQVNRARAGPRRQAARVVVVGAGIGGLAAALVLAARGCEVTLLERATAPGGKMRITEVDGAAIDAGPTVLTMRWVFDELLAEAGAALDDHLSLRRAAILARHAWPDGSRLDLHADPERSRDAVGALAGAAEARGFDRFCQDAARVYACLERPFLRAPAPSLTGLVRGASLPDLWAIRPFATLWRALGDYFRDPRLRQLFARYATYCGSSPFRAPATLMLVAHVEQRGVWLVEGGMHRVAEALAEIATGCGARLRLGAEVRAIWREGGRAAGVRLATGERIAADAVVLNADPAALAGGLFGEDAAGAVPRVPPPARSLSAVTWAARTRAGGFPLVRHNVFFSGDYAAEFADLDRHGRVPREPTVYACAQDRDEGAAPAGPERLLLLVNAPARGDVTPLQTAEIERCETATFEALARQGLTLDREAPMVRTLPQDFARLFPGTGGALYGRASHGWRASFARPGCRTRLPGLYLAGGSIHPGPGVPMAALSGRAAAEALLQDLASTRRLLPTAMPGGTSTA